MCSLFDAILKYDYGCEGDDFFTRMDSYFKVLKNNDLKSGSVNDKYGHIVTDQKRIARLEDLFNRLRMERNNIAHSESTNVKDLSKDELNECLNYVFSISREN